MDRAVSRALLGALVAFALALPAAGQDWAGRGRLNGEVTGPDGKPLAGVTVTLRFDPAPEHGPAPIAADSRGRWAFLGLKGGNWRVQITAEGYVPSEGIVKVTEFGANPAVKIKLRTLESLPAQADPKLAAAQAAIDRGDALLKQQRAAEARAEYEQALPILSGSNRLIVLKRIASCRMIEGDDAGAVETLKTVLAEAPDDRDGLRLIVDRLIVLKRDAEAAEYIARMPPGEGLDPNTLLNMGINLYNETQIPAALEKFEQVVAARPDWADGYYYRGLARLAQNQLAEAKSDFEKVIALDPNHPAANDCREFLKSL